LITIVVVLGLVEFYNLMESIGARPFRIMGIIIAVLLCLITYEEINRGEDNFRFHLVALLLTSLILVTFFRQIFRRNVTAAFLNISSTILGVYYLGWLGSYLILIRQIPEKGAYYTFFLFLVTWIYDAGAYLSGTLFGKHRFLFPEISPRKTWEGFVGGLITALLAAMLAKYYLPSLGISYLHCGFLSLLMVIGGQVGDLAESSLKRNAGVKDSGNLIPGHGGILDRIDGLLFTAPILYYYLLLIL
jgi:phosphatidate cytidylyltransferase